MINKNVEEARKITCSTNDAVKFYEGYQMNTAAQKTEEHLNSIGSSLTEPSLQKYLFKLWRSLDDEMETLVKLGSTSTVDMTEDLREIDDIIEAQDRIADVAFQSQASTFEGLLYKLALWRLDSPDFETMPLYADRKDCIVYSAFRDLVTITGVETVITTDDKTTMFFEGLIDLNLKDQA